MVNFNEVDVAYKCKSKKKAADPNRVRDGLFFAAEKVSFSIDEGECLGIIGPNGGGKSSILKTIIGINAPESGTVEIQTGAGVGYNHGEAEMIEHLKIRENINIVGYLNNMTDDQIQKRIDELDEVVHIKSFLDMYPKQVSSGMRQKANLIRSLIGSPRIVVLDEPTSAVDIVGVTDIQKLIEHERSRGCAVALTSHYPYEIAALCSKLLIIIDGSVEYYGSTESLIDEQSEHAFIQALQMQIFSKKQEAVVNEVA